MADRATQIVNFYESTLASSLIGASGVGTTLSQAPSAGGVSTISATLSNEDTWYYLVVDPDTSGSREVIVIKESSGTTVTNVGRDVEGRYAASSLPEHTSGTTVRMAVLAEHIDDQNDRVATNISNLDSALDTFDTNSSSAISTFNSNGASAISAINASSATAMVSNATDGTSITVDTGADYVLVYDATDSTAKKVYVNQVAAPVEVHPFLVMGS